MMLEVPAGAARAVDEAVRTRRSIRRFRPDPVSRALVREILECALWAPSPHNVQPWRFTVLHAADDKEGLAAAMAARLAADLRADHLPAAQIDLQCRRSRTRVETAPVVVVCSLNADGLVEYADERRRALEWQMAVQSVGAVAQTCFLLAAARGLGTCWMAAPMYCPDEVRRALRLPEDWHPQALLLMGYPEDGGRVRPRRDAAQVIDER